MTFKHLTNSKDASKSAMRNFFGYGMAVGVVFVGLVLPSIGASLDSPIAPCHNPEHCFLEFLKELDKPTSSLKNAKATSKASQLFQHILLRYAQTPWAKRANLRYGYALRTDSPQEAIPLLRSSRDNFPVLGDYLQWWLLQAYEKAELWEEAGEAAEKFAQSYHDSLLRAEVLYTGGDIQFRLENCPAVDSLLSEALTIDPHHAHAARAVFQLGTCAERMGHHDNMREMLRELWWKYPLTPESLRAEETLGQEAHTGFVPTQGERYQRATSLYKNGALKKAVKELRKVVAGSKQTPQYFQAHYMLAKALARLKRYGEAETSFQMLAGSSSSRQAEARVWLGRVYLRQGKGKELARLVKQLPVDRLTGDQQAQLYTFYGIWLRDQDRLAEAVEAYQKAAEVSQKRSKKLKALWKLAWIHYQRQHFSEAVPIFQDIIDTTKKPQSTSHMHAASRAGYWLARSYEQMGQSALAKEQWEKVHQAFPLTYYGQLAQAKLGLRQESPQSLAVLAASHSNPTTNSGKLGQDIHFQKFNALQALQLSQEAMKEFEQVYARQGSDKDAFPRLVSSAAQIGAYDIGIRLAIRHFGQRLRTGKLPQASPAWFGAFPTGYQTMIQSFVPKHVDPYLISGLIREESLYSARVVSPVGAIGLMQLMPRTAKRVAKQLNLIKVNYQTAWLYEPQYNIQIGSHYLGQLLDEFQGNIIYAVAAYNAGPRPVRRWIVSHGHRPADEFVEFIGYRETRGYVKRVVGSYRIYRALFDKPCPATSLDRFC